MKKTPDNPGLGKHFTGYLTSTTQDCQDSTGKKGTTEKLSQTRYY